MSKVELESRITECLTDVALDSRSSTKFSKLMQMLGNHLSIDPEKVGAKALGEPRNYGNRVSEATGNEIELLVLVAEAGVDRSSVRRALEARAVQFVPTILIVRNEIGWSVDSQFVPVGETPPISEAGVVQITRDVAIAGDPDVRQTMRDAIFALGGAHTEDELSSQAANLSKSYPGIVGKRATDSKNLNNRIREAAGRRPEFLVLVVPKGLVSAARNALKQNISDTDGTARFLVWRDDTFTRVEEITTLPSDAPSGRAENVRSGGNGEIEAPGGHGPATEELEYRQLERVKQLRRFLPLDANAENLFEEHLTTDQRLQYQTVTLGFIQKLVAAEQRVVIVLTGNAGHGKTHMCRRLLEQGDDSEDVMNGLHSDIEGRKRWNVGDASRQLRVVKDLSELEPPEHAADILSELVVQTDDHVLVCANEGRLRDVASRAPEKLASILDALALGLERGETSLPSEPNLHVINLNFQAAVTNDGGFFEHVLSHFLDNQAAWNVCQKCRAKGQCPILENRSDLTLSPSSENDNRDNRSALVDLVRIAEETGYVLTYREALVLVAFLITGGLTCEKVEETHRVVNRWERFGRYRTLDLLFEPRLSEDQSEILRILNRVKRLDPGRVALRPVDEELHRELESEGKLGAGVFGDDSAQLRSRRDLDREVDEYCALLRGARRRAWFSSSTADEERLKVSRSQRLGLSYHGLFRSLQEKPDDTEVVRILRKVVKGLHTIQGAVNVDSQTHLHLVDPSFGRSGSHSAIIARTFRVKDLNLVPESEFWRRQRTGNQSPPILGSVEWIDRRVVLVHGEDTALLSFDLLAFEFVMRAADGIVMREFHAADRRRILTRLARHAEGRRGETTDDIRVLLERGEGTLTVERDGTILLVRT